MACSPTRREQIADMAHGRLDDGAATDLLEHVASCEPCSNEFDLVADMVTAAPDLAATAEANTSAPPKNRGLLLLAAALLLITPLLIWQPWGSDPSKSAAEHADLTPPPAPESLLRGEPGPRGEAFARGMHAYGQSEFTAASKELRAVCETRPDDALAHLYYGIAASQTDDKRQAIAPLRVAADKGTGLLKERALWFLANVYLNTEQVDEARTTLGTLRDLDGDYAINAEELLGKLGN